MAAMSQTFTAPSGFEPPYRIEVGGTIYYKSVPSYARAISWAECYAKVGARKVELFDRNRRRVYVSETTTTPA
jgi:hypothetical protein